MKNKNKQKEDCKTLQKYKKKQVQNIKKIL